MNQLLNFIGTVPPDVWVALFAASGLPILIQKIKTWVGLQNPKVIMTVTATLSFATAVIPFILVTAGQNLATLGPRWVAVIGIATLAYRYVIQPATAFLVNYKSYKANAATTVTTSVITSTPIPQAVVDAVTTPEAVTTTTPIAPVKTPTEFLG